MMPAYSMVVRHVHIVHELLVAGLILAQPFRFLSALLEHLRSGDTTTSCSFVEVI